MFVIFFKKFIKEMKRKVTIVFIHHGKIKPLKFNFSIFFLFVLFFGWTSFTLWAGFVSGKYVDYLVVKADCKITKLRMSFCSEQIKKLKENLSQIKQNDDHILVTVTNNSGVNLTYIIVEILYYDENNKVVAYGAGMTDREVAIGSIQDIKILHPVDDNYKDISFSRYEIKTSTL